MVEKEELPSNENDFSDDELVRELLDDKTPFLLLPATIESEPVLEIKTKPAVDRFFTKFYSGPTIGDIKTALTSTRQVLDSQEPQVSPPKVSLLEKGLERNKHTMKIKSTGNGLPEDGYKWRKYGQKLIKNSRNPRSYYRCTNPRCNAKKRVEISNEEPGTLAVTYEGLHLHFGYTHFNLNQPQTSPLQNPNKKRERAPPGPISQTLPGPTSQPALMAGWHQPPQPSTPNCLNTNGAALIEASGGSHQGLLEDIVPLPVRNH